MGSKKDIIGRIDLGLCDRAEELFLRFGIKSVSMDDISHALSISKKTLYKLVPNKAGLVAKILARHIDEEREFARGIQGKAKDPVHELVLIAIHTTEILKKLSPTAIYDLKKYYPRQWNTMEKGRNKLILEAIKSNLEKGVLKDIYRKDLDTDLLSHLYLRMATFITDEKVFEQPSPGRLQLYNEFIKYHIRGIATQKGIRLLTKYEHLLSSQL